MIDLSSILLDELWSQSESEEEEEVDREEGQSGVENSRGDHGDGGGSPHGGGSEGRSPRGGTGMRDRSTFRQKTWKARRRSGSPRQEAKEGAEPEQVGVGDAAAAAAAQTRQEEYGRDGKREQEHLESDRVEQWRRGIQLSLGCGVEERILTGTTTSRATESALSLSSSPRCSHLFILVHNIDGVALRAPDAQMALR